MVKGELAEALRTIRTARVLALEELRVLPYIETVALRAFFELVHDPATPPQLAALYPSQAAYEDAFRKRTDELVAQRFITPEDGAVLKARAGDTKVR